MCSDMTENDRSKQLIDALLPQSNSQSQTAIPEQKGEKKDNWTFRGHEAPLCMFASHGWLAVWMIVKELKPQLSQRG